MRKNVVLGFHFGGPHDRRGKTSVYAFMYGKSSSRFTGTSIFEKKSEHRHEGFFVHLKAPPTAYLTRASFEPWRPPHRFVVLRDYASEILRR